MKNTSAFFRNILTIVCFILAILIILSITLRVYYVYFKSPSKQFYQLKKDGLCVVKNLLSHRDIKKIKEYVENGRTLGAKEFIVHSTKIQRRIERILGPEYKFHDYIFSIKRSQIHTCHRDYNGDFFNKEQKYPSYTIIIYLENMEKCLDIIPQSHKNLHSNLFNLTDPTESVLCNAGDALLFNANLIHNGSINAKEDNMRIQMKISHKVDQKTLHFYQDYNRELDKSNTTSKMNKHFIKHVSCQFPVIGLFTQQYDYDVTKNSNQVSSSIFSKLFYGDSNFYDLKKLTK